LLREKEQANGRVRTPEESPSPSQWHSASSQLGQDFTYAAGPVSPSSNEKRVVDCRGSDVSAVQPSVDKAPGQSFSPTAGQPDSFRPWMVPVLNHAMWVAQMEAIP
ncbi:hypothetical protein MMC14_005262, partial [Varicellaria rhodocarpa]|nr:hypothetical protein [Varicellaria rhodocarpa]